MLIADQETKRVTEIRMRRPDDFHVHLRQDRMLRYVVRYTAEQFGRALVMPNLKPPIRSGGEAVRYQKEIMEAVKAVKVNGFTPLLTIALYDDMHPRTILDARELGVIAAKLYPRGATTNAEDGVTEILKMSRIFEAMQKCGMVLCLHAEDPAAYCLDREVEYIKNVNYLAGSFPELKIVVEHVTSAAMIDAVQKLSKMVAATITAHHLVLTLDDVIGDALHPHAFCKPIAKHPLDRKKIGEVARFGEGKFFFGSDSAPHERGAKECAHGCAGIFSAPVALPFLATWFEQQGALRQLEPFISTYGAMFYGLPPNEGEVVLKRTPFHVPAVTGDVIPFCAGQTLPWSVVI